MRAKRIAIGGAVAVALVVGAFVLAPSIDGNAVLHQASETRAIVRVTAAAVEQHHREKGTYPKDLEQLLNGGYLREMPLDAWRNKLQYRYPSTRANVPFEVWSVGSKGSSSSTIGNW
jgi:hypothetical protein